MNYEQFIKKNNNLLWSIANNKGGRFFKYSFHTFMLNYYEVEDLYQEMLMKLFGMFEDDDERFTTGTTTYTTTICINHLKTMMQPFKAQKNPTTKTTTTFDLNSIQDGYNDFTTEIEKDQWLQIEEKLATHKNKDIIEMILSGVPQKNVGKHFDKTRQSINKIYNDFVKEARKEMR